MSIYKGQLTLCGITYCVEVINGVRYINGKSVSDFVDTLSIEQLREFAKIGARALDAGRNGEAICGKKVQKYEPKDGEFIHLKWKGIKTMHPYEKEEIEAIAIFKEIKNDILYCYITYFIGEYFKNHPVFIPLFDNNGDKFSNGYTSRFDEIRPATEKEKKLLIDQLAKVNKKWNPETKAIEDVRWRAEVGETFYYIDSNFCVNSMVRDEFHPLWKKYDSLAEQLEDERMSNIEYMLWKKGNYFKTDIAANKVIAQILNIFKNSKAE